MLNVVSYPVQHLIEDVYLVVVLDVIVIVVGIDIGSAAIYAPLSSSRFRCRHHYAFGGMAPWPPSKSATVRLTCKTAQHVKAADHAR